MSDKPTIREQVAQCMARLAWGVRDHIETRDECNMLAFYVNGMWHSSLSDPDGYAETDEWVPEHIAMVANRVMLDAREYPVSGVALS